MINLGTPLGYSLRSSVYSLRGPILFLIGSCIRNNTGLWQYLGNSIWFYLKPTFRYLNQDRLRNEEFLR